MEDKTDKLYFKTRLDYRTWLLQNHDICKRFWMIFYKKHTKVSCIAYNDAVEESLCFGWIDSLVSRVDDKIYLRKFTPRKKNSVWSPSNIKRVEALLEKGLFHKSGLETLPLDSMSRKPNWSKIRIAGQRNNIPVLPDWLKNAFNQNEPALTNFNNLAKGYKRQYILWITAAKTDKTRQKRIEKSIGLLRKNKKLGMV